MLYFELSKKHICLTTGLILISFLVVFYAFAWDNPPQNPPDGNVSAPINVSATAQEKAGKLTISITGDDEGSDAFVIKNAGDLRIFTSGNTGSAVFYVDNNSFVDELSC